MQIYPPPHTHTHSCAAKQSGWHRHFYPYKRNQNITHFPYSWRNRECHDFPNLYVHGANDDESVQRCSCQINSFPWAESGWGESRSWYPASLFLSPSQILRFEPIGGETFDTTANQVRTHSQGSRFLNGRSLQAARPPVGERHIVLFRCKVPNGSGVLHLSAVRGVHLHPEFRVFLFSFIVATSSAKLHPTYFLIGLGSGVNTKKVTVESLFDGQRCLSWLNVLPFSFVRNHCR